MGQQLHQGDGMLQPWNCGEAKRESQYDGNGDCGRSLACACATKVDDPAGPDPVDASVDAGTDTGRGVLGAAESASQDSFVDGLLDCPHYTRPEVFEGEPVPQVLLSGNHAEIRRWRLKQALGRTWQRRPDLLLERALSDDERGLLEEFKQELSGA